MKRLGSKQLDLLRKLAILKPGFPAWITSRAGIARAEKLVQLGFVREVEPTTRRSVRRDWTWQVRRFEITDAGREYLRGPVS